MNMRLNKEIGGYFELELRQGKEYHSNAIRLNTCRNAFEYALRANGYEKVYLPFYTCDVMLEPVHKLNLAIEFYSIDNRFRPIFDFKKVKEREVFVYNNYFGIGDNLVKEVSKNNVNIIIDNAQAFFSRPLTGVDTIYSPRKFFGVPDGAYLFATKRLDVDYKQDVSLQRFSHLTGRLELGPAKFFQEYKENEKKLNGLEILQMSKLTRSILKGIDYKAVLKARVNNFQYIHKRLEKYNTLDFKTNSLRGPMVYPYLPQKPLRREIFWEKGIFVAQYWPNVVKWSAPDAWECKLAKELICLPVDQRISLRNLQTMIKICLDETNIFAKKHKHQ